MTGLLVATHAAVAVAVWLVARRRPDPPAAPRWVPTHPAAPRPPLFDWQRERGL